MGSAQLSRVTTENLKNGLLVKYILQIFKCFCRVCCKFMLNVERSAKQILITIPFAYEMHNMF